MTDQPPVKTIHSISDLPNTPAVYAMYGGQGRSLHVAYVGIGGKLRGRVEQHLVRRGSSVATGTSAAWAYMCASILARELAEFGAMWHGCDWDTHTIVRK